MIIVAASQVALLLCVWLVVGRITDGRASWGTTAALTAGALWLEPVTQTLQFGQINVFVMLLVIVDFSGRTGKLPRGLLVGIATGIKLVPGIFILYLFITRRWRAGLVAIAGTLGTMLVGAAAIPQASHEFWLGRLFMDSSRVGNVEYVSDQSVHGAIVRLVGSRIGAEPLWWIVAIAVGAIGLGAAAMLARQRRDTAGLLVCAITGLLVSPISWSHHWVWVAPAAAALATRALAMPSRRTIGALVAWSAAFGSGVLWWEPAFRHDHRYRMHGWQLLIGNAYVLVGLGVLAWAVLTVLRPPAIVRLRRDLPLAGIRWGMG